MRQIIEDSLDFYGVKTRESARSLVARARASARLDEKEAMKLAVDETRNQREQ